ncbi:hypothetical protein PIB30_057791 [Stylosanthes scabra]|uniref:GRF-type domain-containing protein n=1 Tax=Stylosanthes scabra TaxID=79078 RepID=A0ABU6UJ98_9FABA|nr:hypothetical protein [Stylosanthes scabra]
MESEGGCSRSKNSIGGCASENTGSSYAPLDSKCRDDRDGVAPKCHCGVYAILYRSRTRKNPNRLFLGCPFFKQGKLYCSFFEWLDKHCMKLGVSKDGKNGDDADEVNDQFAVIKVDARVAVLENRVQTLTDKIRNVNRLIVVAGIVAMLVAVYVIGS